MADPITSIALGSQAAGALFGVMGSSAAAKAEEQQANINAYIGRTRALQSDTTMRNRANDTTGTMRAALSANGQRPNVGTLELFREFRENADRERSIEYGNRMLEAAQFRTQAANARQKRRLSVPLGIARAGPSLFDLYQVQTL